MGDGKEYGWVLDGWMGGWVWVNRLGGRWKGGCWDRQIL